MPVSVWWSARGSGGNAEERESGGLTDVTAEPLVGDGHLVVVDARLWRYRSIGPHCCRVSIAILGRA